CLFRVDDDIDNCGGGGVMCPGDRTSLKSGNQKGSPPPGAHGRPGCDQGGCAYQCSINWGDCDGRAANGCGNSLLSDPFNCGGCGVHCDGVEGQGCINGQCAMKECPIK